MRKRLTDGDDAALARLLSAHRRRGVLYPVASTLVLTGTGVALARGWPLPVVVLAAGLLGHLVIGVHNAWELADWLATRQ